MTPLPFIAAALLIGVLAGAEASRGHRMALVLASLVFSGIALVRLRGLRAMAPFAVLIAAFAAGFVRRAEVAPLAPRNRGSPVTDRLHGSVERGCVPRGDFSVCTVASTDGTRVELRTPRGACRARPGDSIDAIATRQPIQPTVNGARAGPGASLVRRGITWSARAEGCAFASTRAWSPIAALRRVGLTVREVLSRGLARALPRRDAARADALLFGDESGLDETDGDAFRLSGLTHLLAVSGAHVALLAAALGGGASWLLRRWKRLAERGRVARIATLLPLVPVTIFVVATGESASAMRALVSALAAAIARIASRRARGEVLVAASIIVTLSFDPAFAFDPGWQLSIVAAWALAASPREAESGPRVERGALHSVARFFVESVTASGRVAVAASPVLAWQFQRVPLGALFANALAAPLAEGLALPAVLITGVAGVLAPRIASLGGHITAALLDGMFALPYLALRLPLATAVVPTPTPAQCVLLVAITIVALRSDWATRIAWCAVAVVGVLAFEIPHRYAVHPTGVLRVTLLDVGQGDAILVDLPDGTAMLVDAGGGFGSFDPGARIVVPVLADHRRRELVAVIASHPHPDHIGGIPAVLAWANVESLWDTRQGESFGDANQSYGAMRSWAGRRNVAVRGPETLCGAPRAFHGVQLEVLSPCPSVIEGTPPNDASFVLRLRFGRATVLLPGDLERDGEQRILDALGPVTLLKLGHHGSRTSSTDALLDRVQPRLAIASAGHPSPFGHPHRAVVERLAARGIPLWTTSERGAVTVTLRESGAFEVGEMR